MAVAVRGPHAEAPLPAEYPFCDPHHHLWLREGMEYDVDDLIADLDAGHRVDRTVFVECGWWYRDHGPEHLRTVGETEYVAAAAARMAARGGPRIAGIVGNADLTLGDAVEEVLAAHIEAGGGLFRGIRHPLTHHPGPELKTSPRVTGPAPMRDPAFRRGLARVGAMGLRFDVWLYHPQLPDLVELCQAHPDVPIVVNHLGSPLGIGPYENRWDEVDAVWKPAIAELAATCPNASIKLGGIGMKIYFGEPFPPGYRPTSAELAAQWGDRVRFCIDHFGPDRAMFESNFSVDRETCDYTTLWNAFLRIAEPYTPAERRRLFHDTATECYDLR